MEYDIVSHPKHYVEQSAGGHEPIELCRSFPFELGNALKYLIRAGHKASAPEEQDLKKAKWYLSHLLKHSPAMTYYVCHETMCDEFWIVLEAFAVSNDYIYTLFDSTDSSGLVSCVWAENIPKCIEKIDARIAEIEKEKTE